MISVFEDLVHENELKLDIDKYIDIYYKKYSKDKKNYENSDNYYDYIYSEYSTIKKIEPSISLIEEIESLTIEEPKEYSFDTQTSIKTLFMKYCNIRIILSDISVNSYSSPL